jgi:hypothetical protein
MYAYVCKRCGAVVERTPRGFVGPSATECDKGHLVESVYPTWAGVVIGIFFAVFFPGLPYALLYGLEVRDLGTRWAVLWVTILIETAVFAYALWDGIKLRSRSAPVNRLSGVRLGMATGIGIVLFLIIISLATKVVPVR